jgi:hypothetical protein
MHPICELYGDANTDWVAVVSEERCVASRGKVLLLQVSNWQVVKSRTLELQAGESWTAFKWIEGMLFHLVEKQRGPANYELRSLDPTTGSLRHVWNTPNRAFHLGRFDISKDGEWMIAYLKNCALAMMRH